MFRSSLGEVFRAIKEKAINKGMFEYLRDVLNAAGVSNASDGASS